jgi:lambda family phage minor tail protein L
MPALITQRAQSLEAGTRVELLEADLTSLGGTVYRFHNSTTQGGASITWQGNVYTAYPLKIDGFEYKGQGTLPRPHLHLSNIGSTISALCRSYKDCVGAKVTRHVTFAEFLDGQAGADPTQEFLPDIFYVDRKVNEMNTEIEFELVSAVDLQGIQLPLRQIASNNCAWLYRSPSCTYAGPPVQDEAGNALIAVTDRGAYNSATVYALRDYTYVLVNGIRQYYVSNANSNTAPLTDTTSWTRDWCRKTLTACKARFGATGILPFGAFPGVTALPRL